jgi:hypothetical protein
MNDTTPAIGPIRGVKTSSLLLKINGHTIVVHKGSTVLQKGAAGSWKETARERERTMLFSGKQYCRTYRIQ